MVPRSRVLVRSGHGPNRWIDSDGETSAAMTDPAIVPQVGHDGSRLPVGRHAAYVWGWIRARLSKWLTSPPRRRLLFGGAACVVCFAGIATVLASRSRVVISQTVDPQRAITLSFAPSALAAADGLLYAGSEDGALLAFDAVRGTERHTARVRGKVNYIVPHGDNVFVAGEETITRVDTNLEGPVARRVVGAGDDSGLGAFAGGALGLWGLTENGAELTHFSSESLESVQQFPLAEPATGLAVTEKGIWILPSTGHYVALLRPRHGTWEKRRIALPCHPSRAAPEHDRAFLLCSSANAVVVATDLHARILSLYHLGADSTDIAIANGSLWVLSRSLDHFSQYALEDHDRVGKPVGIGSESNGLAADGHAVWVSEANDSIIRSDLRQLASSRSYRRHRHVRRSWLGISAWTVYAVDLVIATFVVILLILLWQLKVNGPFPTYFPPLNLVVYFTMPLMDALAGTRIEEETHERTIGASVGKAGSILGSRHSRRRLRGRDSLDRHVCRNLWKWFGSGLLYLGANFVPGARHRGTRMQAAGQPTAEDLRAHWRTLGDHGYLCLIVEGCWLVARRGHYLVFTLDYVFDRVAGRLEEVPRPPGSEISFRISKAHLTSSGERYCRPGQRVRLDVIGKALPAEAGSMLAIEPIVAWEPVKPVRELLQLRDYVLTRVSGASADRQ